MSKFTKRHFLKGKEARCLFKEFEEAVGVEQGRFAGAFKRVEKVKTEVAEVFLVDGKPLLAKYKERLIPTLAFEEIFTVIPKIVVDMGAVPHVCNGANVMAPGIVNLQGEFEKNSLVLIVDEKHKKPLAVGIALESSQKIKQLKRGSVAKNVHFVGDKLWKLLKRLT